MGCEVVDCSKVTARLAPLWAGARALVPRAQFLLLLFVLVLLLFLLLIFLLILL